MIDNYSKILALLLCTIFLVACDSNIEENLTISQLKLNHSGMLIELDHSLKYSINNYLKPVSKEIGEVLRQKKIRYTNISIRNAAIVFTLKENKAVDLSSGIPLSRQSIPIKFSVNLKIQDEKYYLVFKLDDKSISQITNNHYKKTMRIIRKRASSLGLRSVTEKTKKGHILVYILSNKKNDKVVNLISANLGIYLTSVKPGSEILGGGTFVTPGPRYEIVTTARSPNLNDKIPVRQYVLERKPYITSDDIQKVAAGFSHGKVPTHAIHLVLSEEGGKKNFDFTRSKIGQQVAMVLTRTIKDANNNIIEKKEIINVATIMEPMFKLFEINNMGSSDRAMRLVKIIHAGAYPAPVFIRSNKFIQKTN